MLLPLMRGPHWPKHHGAKHGVLSVLGAVCLLVATPATTLGQIKGQVQFLTRQPQTDRMAVILTTAKNAPSIPTATKNAPSIPTATKNAPSIPTTAKNAHSIPTPFGWIDFLIHTQQTHRAESELLRLLLQSPQHPHITRAKIQRIRLYQTAQRHRLTQRMAYAFLAQHPNSPHRQHAWALLVNAHLSQGNLAQTKHSLMRWAQAGKQPIPQLPKHLYPTTQTHTLHKVAAWGSVFPGGGFFYQNDAKKGWWTLLLTLGLVGAGAAQFQQKNATTGAGLLVLMGVGVHINAKYGALQQAQRRQTQTLAQARKAWLAQWPGRLKLTYPF